MQENIQEDFQKEKHKTSLITKILTGAVITGTLFYAGCEFTGGYIGIRTRPRPHYSRNYIDHNYPLGFRYPGYNPRIIQPEIRITPRSPYRPRTPSRHPRINTHNRRPSQRSPRSSTPGRSGLSRSRSRK